MNRQGGGKACYEETNYWVTRHLSGSVFSPTTVPSDMDGCYYKAEKEQLEVSPQSNIYSVFVTV